MNDLTTIARVRAVIGDLQGRGADEIEPTATLEALGLDSHDRVQLGLDLEEHFGFSLERQEVIIPDLNTPEGIAKSIDLGLAEQSRAEFRTHSEHSAIDDEPAPLMLELRTADPRFNPALALTVNGYRYEPAHG